MAQGGASMKSSRKNMVGNKLRLTWSIILTTSQAVLALFLVSCSKPDTVDWQSMALAELVLLCQVDIE
jgi:hypothetical protein